MKQMVTVLIACLFFASQAAGGNIFIEEGDLFTATGIQTKSTLKNVKVGESVIGILKRPEQILDWGFEKGLKEGSKLKLLNKGNNVWEVFDLDSEKKLGRLHILM